MATRILHAPGEEPLNIHEAGQVAVRPVGALLRAFLQVFLFHKALGRVDGEPVLQFFAAIVYLAEFQSFVFHPGLDAKWRSSVSQRT
jgi:hypothetical protein